MVRGLSAGTKPVKIHVVTPPSTAISNGPTTVFCFISSFPHHRSCHRTFSGGRPSMLHRCRVLYNVKERPCVINCQSNACNRTQAWNSEPSPVPALFGNTGYIAKNPSSDIHCLLTVNTAAGKQVVCYP